MNPDQVEWAERRMPKRTVSPPTGEIASEFDLRVCAQHLCPVGMVSNAWGEPFICLAKLHRMEIEETRCIPINLPRLRERLSLGWVVE
jgi:hypothetical protein